MPREDRGLILSERNARSRRGGRFRTRFRTQGVKRFRKRFRTPRGRPTWGERAHPIAGQAQ
jgi:hypothetical protein